jgi:hypothetical protein
MSMLGDSLPPAVAAYWEHLDAGRLDEAAASFSGAAVYALPPFGESEVAPRAVTIGTTAIADRFRARGPKPWRHVPVLCLADAERALVEGVLRDAADQPISTYACSVRLGADGLIERFLAFSCAGARDPIPTDLDADSAPADAGAAVHEYFADLDAGRFGDAARRFSEDVLYSHPPYQHTGITDPDRIEFRGRATLEAAFRRRGRADFDHDVLASIQRGPHCMLEGAVNNLPDDRTGSFISSLSLAADGTIRRYVSFYCEPGVP